MISPGGRSINSMIGLEVNSKPTGSVSNDPDDPRSSGEVRVPVRVAIVCAPGTSAEGEAVAALLSDGEGFAGWRFDYQFASGLAFRESRETPFEPDVVIVAFNAISAGVMETLFARLHRTFPSQTKPRQPPHDFRPRQITGGATYPS